MSPHKPVILVTGCSSGIGLALTRQLAQQLDHYRVVATARGSSLSKLTAAGILPSERLRLRPLDVTSAAERTALITEIEQDWGGVDILINNAGISYRSVVEHLTEQDEQHQFNTNYFGPTHLMRLCLPGMRSKREGRIINVSSVGGMMAMPTMGAYSASKFALEGITEALYYEMRPWNVKVSLIQPGFVRSNSFKNVTVSEQARHAVEASSTYANYYWHMSRFIADLMNRSKATPEHIATKIIKLMERPQPPLRMPASLEAYFFTLMTRLVPRRIYHAILYRNLPGIKTWGTGQHDELDAASDLNEIISPKRSAR
ncbi:MAG: NAD(P)-dependent dehydrogenase (short-subunit alcohol dehydrogenase family) [Lentimonas sp.]|jgi:NAD(P)-dependent dehydrogenase (short-subunit alcohol dehydrogenase family)